MGAKAGKLRAEFTAQKQQSEAKSETFTLTIVVAYDHRKVSLDENVPAELNGAITVRWFPEPAKASELARRPECREPLRQVAASRDAGENELTALAEGFALAWHERDYGQATAMSSVFGWLRERPQFRLRRPVPEPPHPDWQAFLTTIEVIKGIEFYWDRGYFDWAFGNEWGTLGPCDSAKFLKFVSLVVKQQPTTFEALDTLL